MKKLCHALMLVVLTLSVTGCVGYRLGSMLPNDINSIHISNFVNKTDEPFLEVDTTSATIEEFQRDGSLEVVGVDDADAKLDVQLVDYDLSPLAYDGANRTQPNEYRIYITAHIKLTRVSTGEVLVENPAVRGDATFEVFGDLTSSKATALPLVSADLAHDIVETVVEYW